MTYIVSVRILPNIRAISGMELYGMNFREKNVERIALTRKIVDWKKVKVIGVT